MARNLKYQFKNAIDKNFKEGQDKHSMKHVDGIGNGKIFSYSDRKNLIDLSSNFSNYLRENYSEVKMVRDIKPEHIQGFFNEKSEKCSKHTLLQYQSKMVKLEQLVNKTYNINSNLTKGYVIPSSDRNISKVRNISMTRDEFNRVVDSMKNSTSSAKVGIEISGRFGLRVSEVIKLQGRDIDVERGIISIVDSKGGRSREITIREEDKVFCREIKEGLGERERVVPLRADSVNRFLSRKLDECGLKEKYNSAKTGIHSIRKMVAQEVYDRCRAEGLSIKESLDKTSNYLGHGKNRDELMKDYVLKIE